MKIGSGSRKWIEEVQRLLDRQHGDSINLFSFLNKESRSKIKVVLWDHLPVCVSVHPASINFWMYEPIFIKLGMYIIAPKPISMAYFI
jgi:hypothetical protein